MRQWTGWALVLLLAVAAQGQGTIEGLDQRIGEVAQLPGQPAITESLGVSRKDLPLRSLESPEPITSTRRRVVLLAGLDGDDRGVSALLGAVRWFKTEAPAALRAAWSLSAAPCGNPEGWVQFKPTNDSFGKPGVAHPPQGGFFNDQKNVEGRYLWRWIAAQAPDLVIQIDGGNRLTWRVPPDFAALGKPLQAQELVSPDSLAMALSRGTPSQLGVVPALVAEARAAQGPQLLQAALRAAGNLPRSPLRQAVARRMARTPVQVAELLAQRYPRETSVQYIPALAHAGVLRLARLKQDAALREKTVQAMGPYLTGEKAAGDDRPDVAALGGYLLFADLAQASELDEATRSAARRLAEQGAERFVPEEETGRARFGRFWTDDMFMTAAPLCRTARAAGRREYWDLAARTLVEYVPRLQRADGLFVHAPDAPHAWGRGNGFAALGLVEVLDAAPEQDPRRAQLLTAYRRLMAALSRHQAPEGTWRQVIDEPTSYREVTATAMNLAAMARGVRRGWLDPRFRPVVERAWQGLIARIGDDGALLDVCSGTGAGPTLRYYLDRPATEGLDDRGGAMCLWAALEMEELQRRR